MATQSSSVMASSTMAPSVQTTAQTELASVGHDGSTVDPSQAPPTAGIDTTPTASVATPYVTDKPLSADTAVYSSYGSESSQFAMQHATQTLPSNKLPLATTEYASSLTQDSESSPSVQLDHISTSPSNSASTVDGLPVTENNLPSDSVTIATDDSITPTDKLIPSSDIQPLPTSTSRAIHDTLTTPFDGQSTVVHTPRDSSVTLNSSQYEPHVSSIDSATDFVTDSASVGGITTSSSALVTPFTPPDSSVKSHISPSTSTDYVATSRDLFSTVTPSKTVHVPVLPLTTELFTTTPVAPLTPSVKPVSTPASGATPLFSGGPTDFLLFVGVPVFGLVLIIVLIVCLVCWRKRRASKKGSPNRSNVQDLWVNSQPELPMSQQESNGGYRLSASKIPIKNYTSSNDSSTLKHRGKRKPSLETVNQFDESIEWDSEIEREVSKLIDSQDGYDDGVTDDDYETEGSSVGDVGDEDKDWVEERSEKCVSDEGCTTYEVVYDFRAEKETHLTLHEGDIVHVNRKETNGWWRGSVGGKSGWFPHSYVQAAPQDHVNSENEVETHIGRTHMSSFQAKHQPGEDPAWSVTDQLWPGADRSWSDSEQSRSFPTEEDIECEPIYCKIQPKPKQKPEPKVSPKRPPPVVNRENSPIPIEPGTKFIALYPYVGHFPGEINLEKGETIMGKERDRNGWMCGVAEATGQEGWFPAVYVDEIDLDEMHQLDPDSDTSIGSRPDSDRHSHADSDRHSHSDSDRHSQSDSDRHSNASDTSSHLDADPDAYTHLATNVTHSEEKRDLVGIMHRANHTFTGEKAGDLSFVAGDTIVVFQVLENGWWLGCKGDIVGWFPGSFVQMINHPSPKGSVGSGSNLPPTGSPTQTPVSTIPDNGDDKSPVSVTSSSATPVSKSRLRPSRKAPPPPTQGQTAGLSGPSPPTPGQTGRLLGPPPPTPGQTGGLSGPTESKLPRLARPIRPARPVRPARPAPPAPLPDVREPGIMDEPPPSLVDAEDETIAPGLTTFGTPVQQDTLRRPTYGKDPLYNLMNNNDNGNKISSNKSRNDKNKPDIPKRYIKPKLITIPRDQINVSGMSRSDSDNSVKQRPRPPPPPRPVAPKLSPAENTTYTNKEREGNKVKVGHSESDSEDPDSFFHVKPQMRNISEMPVRQDSSDLDDSGSVPYRGLSSFGGTFGKEAVPPNVSFRPSPSFKPEQSVPYEPESSVPIHPKLARQEVVKDETVDHYNDYFIDTAENNTQIPSYNNQNFSNNDQSFSNNNQNASNSNKTYPNMKTMQDNDIKQVETSQDVEELNHQTNDSVTPIVTEANHLVDEAHQVQVKRKQAPASKLSPPKQVAPSHIEDQKNQQNTVGIAKSDTTSDINKSQPGVSRIPKLPVAEPVSKIPMSRKDSPSKKADESLEVSEPREPPVVHNKVSPSSDVDFHTPSKVVNDTLPLAKDIVEPTEESSTNHMDDIDKSETDNSVSDTKHVDDTQRPRTDSFDKPPVAHKPKTKSLPKVLPKPRVNVKPSMQEPPSTDDKPPEPEEHAPTNKDIVSEPNIKPKEEESKVSKLPMGKGRKSQIPASPKLRKKSVERQEKPLTVSKSPDIDVDTPSSPVVNLKQKPESPKSPRKIPRQASGGEKTSLRNRSNSPHGRTGIPSSITKTRSASPASKLQKQSSLPSPSGIPPVSVKTAKAVQPQTIQGSDNSGTVNGDIDSPRSQATPSPSDVSDSQTNGLETENLSPKPTRPSKPPRVQKQKSEDGKPPTSGKSLLPVVHKSGGGGSPSTGGSSKGKRGIPVSRPPRPPQPKSPTEPDKSASRQTLYQAVKGYVAQREEELSFTEGTFIKELSDCDRPGWFVGMLADGTTGLYPADHLQPSPVRAQSEA